MVQRVQRKDSYEYVLDGRIPPKLRVKPGETFILETENALSGFCMKEHELPTPNFCANMLAQPPTLNPLSGPIYVEGAEKGDLLAVHIEKILPMNMGNLWRVPGIGPAHDSQKWESISTPKTYVIEHRPGASGTVRDGTGIVLGKYQFEMSPFIGTIGVAPEVVPASALVGQGPWGGNWDCRDICEGTTVLLNVYHEGGLLFVGDVHGMQGDLEFFGVADESRAEVSLHCQVIKNKAIPFPRLEKPDSIVQLWSYRPLDRAVQKAVFGLMDWLVTDYGFTQEEAYLHVALSHDFRINVYQMVEFDVIQFTTGAELPKKYLRSK